ncbi:diacylglycerol kinase family protein [Glutamicibacter endophyticus]
MTNPHAAVVYNPVAAPLEELRQHVQRQEARHKWAPTTWHPSDPKDFGAGAAVQALKNHPEVMIVAGGDGTVRAVASVLIDSNVPIALVPCGTGNLLARNLKVPINDVASCIVMAFQRDSILIDVAAIELCRPGGYHGREIFLVMSGVGLDADMAAATSTRLKKYLGWIAYSMPIAQSVFAHKLFSLTYSIGKQKQKSTRAHTVIIGNCGTLSGNMLLIPTARFDDGLLDVALMQPTRRWGWTRIAARLVLQGLMRRSVLGQEIIAGAMNHNSLSFLQGDRFDATFSVPRPIELDGDSFGVVTRISVRIMPDALKIRSIPSD